MLESEIRKILNLGEFDDIKEALTAATKTREMLLTDGERTVVPLLDHMQLQEKNHQLEKEVGKVRLEIAKLVDDHATELRRRDAEARLSRAVEAGKITPAMAKAWGARLALEAPQEFEAILSSMPRMVTLKDPSAPEDRGNTVVISATEQLRQEIDKRREDLRKAGKTVPGVGELQRMVAEDNPELWNEHVEEQRNLTRGRD